MVEKDGSKKEWSLYVAVFSPFAVFSDPWFLWAAADKSRVKMPSGSLKEGGSSVKGWLLEYSVCIVRSDGYEGKLELRYPPEV